jgi:hypothetical protein
LAVKRSAPEASLPLTNPDEEENEPVENELETVPHSHKKREDKANFKK